MSRTNYSTKGMKWPQKLEHTVKLCEKQLQKLETEKIDDLREKYYIGHFYVKFPKRDGKILMYVAGQNLGLVKTQEELDSKIKSIRYRFEDWKNS